MSQLKQSFSAKPKSPAELPTLTAKSKKITPLIILGVVFVLVSAGAGALAIYAKLYQDKVYQGIFVGTHHVGGLTKQELINFIENINNRYSKEGIELLVKDKAGQQHKIVFNTVQGGDTAVELVRLDSERLAATALLLGHVGGWWRRWWQPLVYNSLRPVYVTMPVSAAETNLSDALRGSLSSFEDAPHDARVSFDKGIVEYSITPEQSGFLFDYKGIVQQIKQNVSVFSFAPIEINLKKFSPAITVSDVKSVVPQAGRILENGTMALQYQYPLTQELKLWSIAPSQLLVWTEVRRGDNNELLLTLQKEAVNKYFDTVIRPLVDSPAQEAKFSIDNGKAREFQASKIGLRLNNEKTYQILREVFEKRVNVAVTDSSVTSTVVLVVETSEPKIKTADVNDLGITEIVGVGVSSFRGSHPNRIKNIARAAQKLNGVLVKPDEEFSTIRYAGPFSAENGYLPELVIKGRQIKKEVGGGMCQIGTTLFRMAMNSGMQITARRNHSLVVNYYADPVNGNPGTDATVYEPILDLKFLNDTGNYLLLQTDVDYKKMQLTFTLWGRPDGRKGWYSHPTVGKWIPAGEPEEIIVTDGTLKPGEKDCQMAYRGAVASFTYTRITPQGEKVDRVFDSFYRPLPKICMVGAELSSPCPEGQECSAVNGEQIDQVDKANQESMTASGTTAVVP